MAETSIDQLICSARQCVDCGELSRAVEICLRILDIDPENPVALELICIASEENSDDQTALKYLKQALRVNNENPSLLGVLARITWRKGKPLQALPIFEQAIQNDQENTELLFDLALAHKQLRNPDASLNIYQRILSINSHHSAALHNVGMLLKNAGDLNGALDYFRRAVAANPQSHDNLSSVIYTMHFHPDCGIQEIRDAHTQWNAQFAQPLHNLIQPHTNSRQMDRRIKIGYVSPNFSTHPVGRFMLALAAAHQHSDFEIFYYSDRPTVDDVGQRIQSHADHWIQVDTLSDSALADRIRADGIDILIDLNMHMSHSRMLMFARKPAPIQMTYLAYCSTTGLDTMDYRISDPYLDPPEQGDPDFVERTLRLPQTYWCYAEPAEKININPLPALKNDYVTFASLNNFCKVTPSVLALWARLLAAVPKSRLLIHSWPGSVRQRTQNVFAQFGIHPDRLQFFDRVSLDEFFKLHHSIDIALDPFPYPGGTTTCDSLWMGVPTISLVGNAPWKRAGASIMHNMNMPEFATSSEDQYLQTSLALASDLPRLANLRAILRQRFMSSPLMNARAFATDMENLYRQAWQTWCAA